MSFVPLLCVDFNDGLTRFSFKTTNGSVGHTNPSRAANIHVIWIRMDAYYWILFDASEEITNL